MTKLTIREARQRLAEKALADEAFRKKLVENPKACVEEEFGVSIPDHIELSVLEETPEKVFLVLPAKRRVDLSQEELDRVAAGEHSYPCQNDPTSCF